MLPNQLNHTAFHTPTNSIDLSCSTKSSNPPNSPPSMRGRNAAAAVHALAGQLLFEQAAQADAQMKPVRPPMRLLQPALVFAQRSQAEESVLLYSDLHNWVSAAASAVEKTERSMVALSIVSCFENKNYALFINAEHITHLPNSIGLLRHLILLDLSGCRALQSLPNVMENFSDLQRLDLTNCASLTALPPSVMAVSGFGHLFLNGSGINIANPLQSQLTGSTASSDH